LDEILGTQAASAGTGGANAFRSSLRPAPSAAGSSSDGAAAISEDIRTLPAFYDTQGERWRTFGEAVTLLEEDSFNDWPLGWKRSTLWRLKNLKRNQLTPLQQHSRWTERARIPKGDRVRIEHEVLSKICELIASYDQINAANSAGVEVAVERLQMIESAYQKGPNAPEWDRTDEWLGNTLKEDGTLIAPFRIKKISEARKAENEITKERRKAREEAALKKK
jgi:hypothetical protein